MSEPLPAPPSEGGRFTNDPVRVAYVLVTFIQAVNAALLVGGVVTELVGGIIVAVTTAAYAAVSELFVRPATVPRAPLEALATGESG